MRSWAIAILLPNPVLSHTVENPSSRFEFYSAIDVIGGRKWE
jgi:hypothetical protein